MLLEGKYLNDRHISEIVINRAMTYQVIVLMSNGNRYVIDRFQTVKAAQKYWARLVREWKKTPEWIAFDRNGRVLKVGDMVYDEENDCTYELSGEEDVDSLWEVSEKVEV